jgi:superfamily II DNA or RNA helicase
MKELIEVSIYNHKTIVDKASVNALESIARACTLVDGYRDSSGSYQVKERFKFFDKYDQSFPSGYIHILAEKLEKEGIDIEAVDMRDPIKNTAKLSSKNPGYEKRYNQERVYDAISEGHNVGFITSPTGTGKTNSIADAIDICRVNTLIITPTTGVRNMMAKNLQKTFGKSKVSTKISSFGGSIKDLKEAKNYRKKEYNLEGELITGPQSIEEEYLADKGFDIYGNKAFRTRAADKDKKRPGQKKKDKEEEISLPPILVICIGAINHLPTEVLEFYEMLLVDEGQFGKCATIRDLSYLMPNAYYKYAFSATNGHEDLVKMELLCSVFGNKIIFETSAPDAVEAGIIQKVKMRSAETRCNHWLKDNKGKYVKYLDDIIKLGIIGNSDRNDMIAEDVYDIFFMEKGRILMEVGEEYHAHILAKKLEEKGVPCHLLYADMKPKDKNDVLEMLEHGEDPYVVLATSTARQGINTVTVSHIWLADARKSIIDLIQWIGRAQRIDGLVEQVHVINPKDHFHPKLFEWSNKRERDFEKYYESGEKFTEAMFSKHKLGFSKVS